LTGTADLIVVGGGLMGLATALHAAQAGLDVTILECQWPGRHASGANAGGVRSLNRHDAEIPLARAALAIWRELEELIGDTGGFVASGQVRVAEDAAQAAELQARVARLEAMGYDHERWIGGAELRACIPALAPHCTGAIVVDDDGHADPHRTTRAFATAVQRQGVRVITGTPVSRIECDGPDVAVVTPTGRMTAAMVVNAAGAWGADLAESVGDHVPLTATALQMLVTDRLPAFLHPVVGSAGRKLSFKQLPTGQVVIGGGFEGSADPATGRSTLDHAGLARNVANARALFPEPLDRARIIRAWAGIEGVTADGLPVIDRSPAHRGLVHAFGFSAHGFALSPLVGRLVTDVLLNRPSNLDLAPFALDRFNRPGGEASCSTPRVASSSSREPAAASALPSPGTC
jgi:sarcosine oxidase, subunit beta